MTPTPSIDGMTDEQIIEAVATEVMGWSKGLVTGDGDCLVWVGPPKLTFVSEWNPLTDWNATKDIEQAMREKHSLVLVEFPEVHRRDGLFCFCFGIAQDRGHRNPAVDPSEQHAICLAALQAIRTEP